MCPSKYTIPVGGCCIYPGNAAGGRAAHFRCQLLCSSLTWNRQSPLSPHSLPMGGPGDLPPAHPQSQPLSLDPYKPPLHTELPPCHLHMPPATCSFSYGDCDEGNGRPSAPPPLPRLDCCPQTAVPVTPPTPSQLPPTPAKHRQTLLGAQSPNDWPQWRHFPPRVSLSFLLCGRRVVRVTSQEGVTWQT